MDPEAHKITTELRAVRDCVNRQVAGQSALCTELLMTIVAGEHCLVEGSIGVGKWRATKGLAEGLGLTVAKLRSSTDLCIEDLVRIDPVTSDAAAVSLRGPLAHHVLFVEEPERLPLKLQSLLQQAMQERQIDVAGKVYSLPSPFVVVGSRRCSDDLHGDTNLMETDDRFWLKLRVPYPPYHAEYTSTLSDQLPVAELSAPLFSVQPTEGWRNWLMSVEVPPPVGHFAVRLARATRIHEGENPDFIYEWVEQGVSPRASRSLVLAAQARAFIEGRTSATLSDVVLSAPSAFRHRIVTNRNARENGITVDRVVQRLLNEIPQRIEGDDVAPTPGTSFSFHNWTAIDPPDHP